VSLVKKHDKTAIGVKDRDDLVSLLKQNVVSGDTVLVMGARDPSLSGLVEEIKRSLQEVK
jgi:UDP-N-acetylmuramyl pentapeptide synthase